MLSPQSCPQLLLQLLFVSVGLDELLVTALQLGFQVLNLENSQEHMFKWICENNIMGSETVIKD